MCACGRGDERAGGMLFLYHGGDLGRELVTDRQSVLDAIVEIGEAHKGIKRRRWLCWLGKASERSIRGRKSFIEGEVCKAGVDAVREVEEDTI